MPEELKLTKAEIQELAECLFTCSWNNVGEIEEYITGFLKEAADESRTPEPDNDALTASYMLGVEKGKQSILEDPTVSIIRWTRYDGTPETSAESHRVVLFVDDDEVRCGRVVDDERGMRLQVGKLLRLVFEVGDLWAYLPEPPEGMQ